MAKKIMSVVLILVMVFMCALPAFALTDKDAQSAAKDRIWMKDENATYSFEDTDDYIAVTVVNYGVTFVFHVKSIAYKPKLVSYSFDGDMQNLQTFVSLFNAILLKIASAF